MGEQTEVTFLDSISCGSEKEAVLVGRLIADRKINWGTVRGVLKWSWSEMGEIKISGIGMNTFLFEFQDPKGAERVLTEGPWSVDGHCLTLVKWSLDSRLEDVDLSSVIFWVQIHGLCRDQMIQANAVKLGEKIGRVVKVDDSFGGKRCFMRVRVEFKIDNPLVKGAWVQNVSGKKYWVEFKYERLSAFCFNCGRLDHTLKTCKRERCVSKGDGYGTGLRAGQDKGLQYTLNERKEKEFVTNNSDSPIKVQDWDCGETGRRRNGNGGYGHREGSEVEYKDVQTPDEETDKAVRRNNGGTADGKDPREKQGIEQRVLGAQKVECSQQVGTNVEEVKKGEAASGEVVTEYIVELPQEEDKVDYCLAIVPYDLTGAMDRLSLKRKLDEVEHCEQRNVRRRVCMEEKGNSVRNDKGKGPSVRRKTMEKEKQRGMSTRRRARPIKDKESEGRLVEVAVSYSFGNKEGCGGLPEKATEGP